MLRQSKQAALQQRSEITNRVMTQIKALEVQSDQTVAASAQFMADFCAARSEAQLSPIFGYDAVSAIAAANAAFAAGMEHIAIAHARLRTLPPRLGLKAAKWGEVEDSPGIYDVEQPALKVVTSQ